MRWIKWGVATAVVHQGCPIPIDDFDIVAWAGGEITTSPNIKVGELQPQYLTTFHLNAFCLVNQVRIVVRVVWWGDNTCKKNLSTWSQEHFDKSFSTHPRCHSLLQGKASLLVARLLLQCLNQEHKQGSAKVNQSTGRSSSGRRSIYICSRRLPCLCRGCQGRQGCTLQRNVQWNVEKWREFRDILMTFMTHGNVIFDILEPQHLENMAHVGSYRICAWLRGQCNSCKSTVWFCSVDWTLNQSEKVKVINECI